MLHPQTRVHQSLPAPEGFASGAQPLRSATRRVLPAAIPTEVAAGVSSGGVYPSGRGLADAYRTAILAPEGEVRRVLEGVGRVGASVAGG